MTGTGSLGIISVAAFAHCHSSRHSQSVTNDLIELVQAEICSPDAPSRAHPHATLTVAQVHIDPSRLPKVETVKFAH
ncbi:hypothetical protein TYRP_007954 [Tyrophagus putrescentiae]|nr:hypothetical protein TYRP_007954 [Tyrophagus putrescentiae]